jgi:epoxyqueuosine reductase QueG
MNVTQSTLQEILAERFEAFVRDDPSNRLPDVPDTTIFDAPLVTFGSVEDPLFETYKDPEVIGPDHLTPSEWFPKARSVISYFLPFTKKIRRTNRELGLPSFDWVSAKTNGEHFNNAVRRMFLKTLPELGGEGLAPALDPRFKVSHQTFRSNWSERHVGYASGLGTFSLHKGLITRKGCAGRVGSVITSLEIEPTVRPYKGRHDYCLFLMNGTCGACIKRCPSKAVTEQGKDHVICATYSRTTLFPIFEPYRGGCGKCQTTVPCESQIPVPLDPFRRAAAVQSNN